MADNMLPNPIIPSLFEAFETTIANLNTGSFFYGNICVCSLSPSLEFVHC